MAGKVDLVRWMPQRAAPQRGRKRRRHAAVMPAAFAEVRLAAAPMASSTRLEARLANGASLAIESNESAQELLLTALVALAGRR
jgi:hypothetical protein